MKTTLVALTAAAAIAVPGAASAGVLQQHSLICPTKEAFVNVMDFAEKYGAGAAGDYIRGQGCIYAPGDMQVEVLERYGWTLSAKVLIEHDGHGAVGWVPSDFVTD